MSKSQELKSVWTDHANVGDIPCLFTNYNFLRHPLYVNERPEGQDGYDWFGVHWTYDPSTNAPMPTVGIFPMSSPTSRTGASRSRSRICPSTTGSPAQPKRRPSGIGRTRSPSSC